MNTPKISATNKPVTKSESKSVVKEPAVNTTPSESELPKKPTKADRAKMIYDELIIDSKNDRQTIVAKIKKELGTTKAASLTYYYKFQKETGRVSEKQPTKMDAAKVVYSRMTSEGKPRKEIIEAFTKEIDLTPAGASTYYQNIKKEFEKSSK